MRSLEVILKFVDTYNRNIYRIYYYLYLSNNFNYCAIQIITYFRAFEDNIFSGQRILFILKKLLLKKIYNIISNKSQFNLLKEKKNEFKVFEGFSTNFLLAVPSRPPRPLPAWQRWQGHPDYYCTPRILHIQTTACLDYCMPRLSWHLPMGFKGLHEPEH